MHIDSNEMRRLESRAQTTNMHPQIYKCTCSGYSYGCSHVKGMPNTNTNMNEERASTTHSRNKKSFFKCLHSSYVCTIPAKRYQTDAKLLLK